MTKQRQKHRDTNEW